MTARPAADDPAPSREPSSERVTTSSAADLVVARISDARRAGRVPLVVGIDGRSGAGKSTLARAVAARVTALEIGPAEMPAEVTVIEGDDFYGGGSAEAWDRRSPTEQAARVIDWRRQRVVLECLRAGHVAEWHPFDWDAEGWDSDAVPVIDRATRADPTSVVVLEGAYSCRPELHDLLDLRVLLAIPTDVRRRRLLERNGADHRADWDRRWSAAEEHYFGEVMPPHRFDLVVGPGHDVRPEA